ncbi:MAG: FlgD immunoglobulin-like domain containing protein, partial [Elusimicrobiota bacterium]
GNISGAVSITDLIKNLPLATSITVEIKVKDSAGNISAAGVSQSIKIAVAGAIPQVKLINNLFDPTQSGQKLYIRYELPEASNISVSVHDVTGVEIKKILENVQMPAGAQLIEWAGRNAADEVVASGTYIVYLQAGSYKLRKKVIVMK